MSYHGPPPYQPGQPGPPMPRRRGGLLVGLVLGLVFGAAAVGVTWAITASGGSSASGGAAADAEAVCGVVERTPVPERIKDLPIEDIRRWGVAEVGPSLAKQDPSLKPLADALDEVRARMLAFDLERARDAIDRVKGLCADL